MKFCLAKFFFLNRSKKISSPCRYSYRYFGPERGLPPTIFLISFLFWGHLGIGNQLSKIQRGVFCLSRNIWKFAFWACKTHDIAISTQTKTIWSIWLGQLKYQLPTQGCLGTLWCSWSNKRSEYWDKAAHSLQNTALKCDFSLFYSYFELKIVRFPLMCEDMFMKCPLTPFGVILGKSDQIFTLSFPWYLKIRILRMWNSLYLYKQKRFEVSGWVIWSTNHQHKVVWWPYDVVGATKGQNIIYYNFIYLFITRK